jgi:hypothetical protein
MTPDNGAYAVAAYAAAVLIYGGYAVWLIARRRGLSRRGGRFVPPIEPAPLHPEPDAAA